MTGLEGNTNYYVRAFASNQAGTAYGNQQTFKTSLVEKATVITESPSNITTSSALIGGSISTDGGSAVTERGIYWGSIQNSNNYWHQSTDRQWYRSLFLSSRESYFKYNILCSSICKEFKGGKL